VRTPRLPEACVSNRAIIARYLGVDSSWSGLPTDR
jgi:hypothetical protein